MMVDVLSSPPPDRTPGSRVIAPPRPIAATVGRRRLLTAAGVGALLLTAGCNPFSTTRTTRTVVTQAPPPVDPMDTLIATTRLHLLRLEAALGLGGATAKKLTPLRNDRRQHLQRLVDEQARVNRTEAGPLVEPGQSVPAPKSPAEAIKSAVNDAVDAQSAFGDQIAVVSRYRAAMFASIAACLAGHRVMLQ